MNFITKNLKQAGIFNLVLIVVAIVLEVVGIIGSDCIFIDYALSVAKVLSLLSGSLYALYGYKKEAAKYYKGFMFLYFVSVLISIYGEITYLDYIEWSSSMLSTYANFARFIPILLLTFIPNFGEKKSKICAYILFGLSLFIFARAVILYGSSVLYVANWLSEVAASAIACIFVNEKYADKTSRGAK